MLIVIISEKWFRGDKRVEVQPPRLTQKLLPNIANATPQKAVGTFLRDESVE